MNLVVAIVGPTGIGKSNLGILLGQTFDAELVNADSRQIYRYMDIGTAKPGPEERASVPHHLIDIVNPDEDFSLALYQSLARVAIDDIRRRGKLPILVGGSGLYVWAVLEGWNIPQVPPDIELRRRLEARARAEGVEALYRQLQEVDAVSAARINRQNLRRIIRALEVYEATGRASSQVQGKTAPPFDSLIIGLSTNRALLYKMINSRVDHMMRQGLVAEVRSLMARGYGLGLPSMSSVGYRQIGRLIQGDLDQAAAVQQIKFETHRFARHQYAWFRLTDPRIKWFDIRDDFKTEAVDLVGKQMQGSC